MCMCVCECMYTTSIIIIFSNVLSLHTQPERILGGEYGIHSEVWSLGVSVLEVSRHTALYCGLNFADFALLQMALGRFPYLAVSSIAVTVSPRNYILLPLLLSCLSPHLFSHILILYLTPPLTPPLSPLHLHTSHCCRRDQDQLVLW